MKRWPGIGVLLVGALIATSCVPPVGPGGGPQPTDCTHWRYGPQDEPAPGTLPPELDTTSYKVTAGRDPNPALFNSPHNQCGQKGPALDLAFGVTQGRDDVRIADLDSGIEWRDPAAMADLATKIYINLGEAKPPCWPAVPNGDCNHDGVFNITDFGPIPDLNHNGVADPEDLILNPKYSNGVDDDHNGYVDDIAGWDFLYNDNDPLDTVNYGHGTGEAKDSTAAANGVGSVGTCPMCRMIPVRVGDSFLADGGRFAAGVMFGLDSGADVIQEALGALSNPRQAQMAVDAAYNRSVVVVASMADEASKHPNLPSSLEHTMAVNSITTKQDLTGGGPVQGYLALNGCTNFGGHTFVSIPSGACSSEATGRAAGMVGLIESEARAKGVQLSANEVMQIVRATADDIDFSTPNAVDPANDFGTPTGGLIDTVRYPTTPGWDATNGYGRINIYEAVKAVRNDRIPPEADITSPTWFQVLPTTGHMIVRGRVAASRAASYDYKLEWATGVQPPNYPAKDVWHVAAQQSDLHTPLDGVLGNIDLASIAAALPNDGSGTPVDPSTSRPDEERFSVRLRVVVNAHGGASDGLEGEFQKQIFVHNDPDLVNGFPIRLASVGNSSPVFANLDGKKGNELIVATDDGLIHAFRSNGTELPGWPVRTITPNYWPFGSRTAIADHIPAPGSTIATGAPVIADLDHNGKPNVIVTDFEGNVWAYEPNGERRPGFGVINVNGKRMSQVHVNPAFSADIAGVKDQFNRTLPGFTNEPAVGDLDHDGQLEIVAAALDRHIYAFHADGTPVNGFPVLLVDPSKVTAVDPVTNYVTFAPGSGAQEGGELIATPTLADINGDGRPEIIEGAQESYEETPNIGDGSDVVGLISAVSSVGNARIYAISPDGTNAHNPTSPVDPDAQAYLPGWPAKLGMLQLNVLPTIGDGVSAQAVVADVNPAPGKEIIASSAAGPLYVLNAQGNSVFGKVDGKDVPAVWSGGVAGQNNGRFGPLRNSNDIVATTIAFGGASIGDLNGDGVPDPTAPSAGLTRLIDVLAPDLQLPNDDHVMAWSGITGNALPGFPQTTPDLAFFASPAVADLAGNGHNDTIVGNGVYTLSAFDANGAPPPGWPKLTGGWLVGTPGLGDWDGDGKAEIAVTRRDGWLLVWHTNAPASSLTEWPRSGGNDRNTGEYHG
jgi:hypothetical protein